MTEVIISKGNFFLSQTVLSLVDGSQFATNSLIHRIYKIDWVIYVISHMRRLITNKNIPWNGLKFRRMMATKGKRTFFDYGWDYKNIFFHWPIDNVLSLLYFPLTDACDRSMATRQGFYATNTRPHFPP